MSQDNVVGNHLIRLSILRSASRDIGSGGAGRSEELKLHSRQPTLLGVSHALIASSGIYSLKKAQSVE